MIWWRLKSAGGDDRVLYKGFHFVVPAKKDLSWVQYWRPVRFKVYIILNASSKSTAYPGDLAFREVCQTASQAVAEFAVKEEAAGIGKDLYVLVIDDGKLSRVVPGKA